MPKYDLAISFAGEQRSLASSLAIRLDAAGYSVFYDQFASTELWGQDLTTVLADVYGRDARHCLIIVSKEYVRKSWPNLERQHAIARFMERRDAYLLCLLTDDTKLPGLPSTIAYLDLRENGEASIYRALLQKLGPPDHQDLIPSLSEPDRQLAKEVLQACYTRAVFTRMYAEITVAAMIESIERTIDRLQELIPRILDQHLQYTTLQILEALDAVERTRGSLSADFGAHLKADERQYIDTHKREVLRLLLEVRRAGMIPMQLPFSLGNERFYGTWAASAADGRPDASLRTDDTAWDD